MSGGKLVFQHHAVKGTYFFLGIIFCVLCTDSLLFANHRASDGHSHSEVDDSVESSGHVIPGASFQVYWAQGKVVDANLLATELSVNDILATVIQAFNQMVENRIQYTRFDEALTKGVLHKVVIEPQVFNRDGKEFMFLVARTKRSAQVKLLINASRLKEESLVNHPGQLVPLLAREFQWIVGKSDTSKKRQPIPPFRDLQHAPIQTWKAIKSMDGAARRKNLQALLEGYLTTIDEYHSLQQQPYYAIGSATSVPPAQEDSTTKLYDIRVREALQQIVEKSRFLERMPQVVQSLLDGKIWNVSFTRIASRDWATRTRVLPKDKAVKVGEKGKMIQPAKILINLHRKAAPDDPYYDLTKGLPMGALSTDQLAQVIALEIENQIIEKSMRGHVAEDARSLTK